MKQPLIRKGNPREVVDPLMDTASKCPSGGGLVPNVMGLSKQYFGTYMWGFVLFAVLTLGALTIMRSMQIRWTRTWAEKGGRARSA